MKDVLKADGFAAKDERRKEYLEIALSTMMSSTEEYSYMKDLDGRYVCCSRAAAGLLGLSSEKDIAGRTDEELFEPALAAHFKENDQKVYASRGMIVDEIVEFPLRGGGCIYVSTSVYPLMDASGRMLGVYGIGRDVTKERKLDFELNTLLYAIPSGVFKYAADETEAFAYINRNLIESLGYTEESFRAKFHNCFREMIYQEDREAAEAEIIRQESSGRIGKFDYRIEAADGQLRWFHDEGIKVTDQDGKAWYYVTLVEITESRENYAQLKLMTDSIPSGLVTYVCGVNGIHITYYNNGFSEMLGFSREQLDRIFSADPISYVLEEDRGELMEQYERLMRDDTPIDCVYRIQTSNREVLWVHQRAVVLERHGGLISVNAVIFDITQQQEAREKLRVSEEINRLAIQHSGKIVTRFDVKRRTLTLPETLRPIFQLPRVLENVPEEQIALGRISPETADVYRALFTRIKEGSASGGAVYQQRSALGWRWLEAQYTTVFSGADKPVYAVITFTDITEQQEKEVVYSKWQQSLQNRAERSYTLLRCNLSKNSTYESCEGTLIDVHFNAPIGSFTELVRAYAMERVLPEDRDAFLTFADSNALLAGYYRGHRSDAEEYREADRQGAIRWIRLSVELVEYPNVKEVEAFLMFEDITAQKEAELEIKERAETDPLTGSLNRAAFAARMEQIVASAKPGAQHALLMVDIDGFKRVNDSYGHAVGDRVLCEMVTQMRSVLRQDDLLGRLGGDEFFIFLKGMPNCALVERKVRQLCALDVRIPNTQERVSISIGIAMLPHDGLHFDTLYKKVDDALYRRKHAGKDGYFFASAAQDTER